MSPSRCERTRFDSLYFQVLLPPDGGISGSPCAARRCASSLNRTVPHHQEEKEN